MTVDDNVLGTKICPKDFDTAARQHGRFFARYRLAASHAAGKDVLDAACGSGFGSAWLARTARSVLGVDLDDVVLGEAAHWTQPAQAFANLRFQKHDLAEPFAAGTRFDLIVSFETLEHVRDPAAVLANFAAHLTPGGLAIISIPNGSKELRDGDWEPSHHVHFSAEDFRRLVAGSFGQAEFYSEFLQRGLRHYLRKICGGGRHHADDYRFVPGLDERAKTWVAICRGAIGSK
jgi:2-polyprenyl-3-methyl-5-hydroxy-6-metoxy-1,4-benzoquinol methylase